MYKHTIRINMKKIPVAACYEDRLTMYDHMPGTWYHFDKENGDIIDTEASSTIQALLVFVS